MYIVERCAAFARTFRGQRAARVVIECKDARRGEHLQATRKGDPDMPLDDRELEQKFLELTTPVLGDTAARALVARLWALERAPTV